MTKFLDDPFLVSGVSLVFLWFSAWTAALVRQWTHFEPSEDYHRDFNVIISATLTLLALIIGFSFSMAVNGFDRRSNAEEREANAIQIAYTRADLMPQAEASQVRALLRQYADLRIRFFNNRDHDEQQRINRETAELQNRLWATVVGPAVVEPTPTKALTISGMNDLLSAQMNTQAAWWDRIPTAAWGMMFVIAVFSNVMLGHGSSRTQATLFMVLPFVVAFSFFLIADIDSPWQGIIHVETHNLENLSVLLHAQ